MSFLAITTVMAWYSADTGTTFITQDPIQITLERLFKADTGEQMSVSKSLIKRQKIDR